MIRVPLLARQGEIRTWTTVDAADVWLLEWHWRLSARGYATRFDTATKRPVYMHRAIMGLALGEKRQVDHINQDKLDNRRSNLRVVTPAQQSQNVPSRGGTSRHRGVCWDRSYGTWIAYAQLNGRHHRIGSYATEDEAAAAAVAWRTEHMPFAVEEVAS